MDEKELISNFGIVFDKEESDFKKGAYAYAINSLRNTVEYPNAETLIDLYETIKHDQQLSDFFVNNLEYRVEENQDDWRCILYSIMEGLYEFVAPLCFYTLVLIGFQKKAIDALNKRKKNCDALYNLISAMLPINYFDNAQLKVVLDKIRLEKTGSFYGKILEDKIVNCRYEILKKQVKKVNVEINQDKKVVSQKINSLGFNTSYNKLLDEIDNFILSQTSDVVNAGMISNLRALTADLMKAVAIRIAEKEKETIPKIEGRGELGSIRGYLKTKLDLSSNDDKFIDSFVDILHSEGGHSFMSEKEYFRLARNIAIEIAFFVLSKYERKFGR